MIALLLAGAPAALAQRSSTLGRFSLFYNLDRRTEDGGADSDYSLITAYFSLRSPVAAEGGFEYSIDARTTAYPSSDRDARVSVYDAYVGGATLGGRLGLRVGQMWLNDLGALGSVGGVNVEYRLLTAGKTRYRFGLFGGLEPKVSEAGYADGVRKGGVYIAYDGHAARRHVLGFVALRNQGIKERSVLTATNFVPAGSKFFLYQLAEYDLHGPGGEGGGNLSYFFATARVLPVAALELQANYHRGRSIDARAITNDQINGRPVDPRLLEAYLFESAGGRIAVNISRRVRLQVAYARERNNREDKAQPRYTGGFSLSNVLGSGVDFSGYASRIERSAGPYTSFYASVGRALGSRFYLSADYTSSLSVIRFTNGDGATIENRPETQRFALSAIANLSRRLSLFLTLEHLLEEAAAEDRIATGLTIRF